MKGKVFVAELAEGARVDSPFVVRSREVRAARTGDAYLSLELADRSGRMSAVLFRPDVDSTSIPTGTVIQARGTVTSFRGVRRLSLDSIRPAAAWNREDMLASGTRPRKELVAELRTLVAAVSQPELARLLRAVFGDRAFFKRFSMCPGSQSYHHACLGGLLQHTVSVARQASNLASTYPGVDADLLLTAALLHDVGKVDELVYETSIEYSDAGRLLGHVTLGAQLIHENGVACGIEPGLLNRLEHAVLSHHGELEWGSPKRPSTVEALLLHHIDNLDAKTTGFLETLQGAALVEEQWTDSFNLFRRPLYSPAAIEDDRPNSPSEDVPNGCLRSA